MKYEELTDKIISAFFKVYNTLGFGFSEKVYENAMYLELKSMGFKVEQQSRIEVYYEEILVGEYYSDLTVEDIVICELKANENLSHINELQLLNYLKATDKEVGLLFNFGKKPELKRKVFDNSKKSWYTTRITGF